MSPESKSHFRISEKEAHLRWEALRLLYILRQGKINPSDTFVIFTELSSENFFDALNTDQPISLNKPIHQDGSGDPEERTLADIIPANGPGTEEVALSKVAWMEIERWMDDSGLNQRQQTAIKLCFVEGHQPVEIARIMGLNNRQRASQLIDAGIYRLRNNPEVARFRPS